MAATEEKLNFKKLFPVFLIVLIDLMGLTIVIPLLPLYAASFGANAFTIGLLGASYPLMQLIGAPLLGGLSDSYGRKPVLVISQAGTFASLLMLGFAPTLVLIFLARLLDGLTGGNISTAQAVITDNTTEKTRTQGLGLIGAAFGIGFILGPIIAFASLAASGNNYHVPAFVAAAFSFGALLLNMIMLEESLPPEKRSQGINGSQRTFSPRAIIDVLRRPQVGILLVLMFAQQIAFGGMEQLLSLFTLNRLGLNASGNALIFTFVGVIVVAVQGKFIGDWSRRYGERNLVFFGLGMLGLGLILTATTPRQPVAWYSKADLQAELSAEARAGNSTLAAKNIKFTLPEDNDTGWRGLAWILVAMIPAAIGGGVLHPSINSLLTQHVSPGETGSILGMSASFMSGANAVAPVIGGAMFQAIGASAPFIGGGILLGVLLIVAWQAITPSPVKMIKNPTTT